MCDPASAPTHIVENLGVLVKNGKLTGCEFINVESEFAALGVATGSSAAGARSYTATASQAYTNTGVQRSSATPGGARTATTMPVGEEPGADFGQGKSVPLIERFGLIDGAGGHER